LYAVVGRPQQPDTISAGCAWLETVPFFRLPGRSAVFRRVVSRA